MKYESLKKLGFKDCDCGYLESRLIIGSIIIHSYMSGKFFEIYAEKKTGEEDFVCRIENMAVVDLKNLIKIIQQENK